MRQFFSTISVMPLLLILAACQPAPEATAPRTVVVNGTAELSVPPEIATVRLAIEARAREVAAAQSQAGKVVNDVLTLVESLGIPAEQVQSTRVTVHPEYDWRDGQQTFRGYLVQREVHVELEDLAKIGPLVERALQAGVNNVSPPELAVRDPRRLHREALQQAAADARANAEALAATLDVKLGTVRHIDALESAPPQPKMEMQMMRAADASGNEGTYETGRINVSASVRATFEVR